MNPRNRSTNSDPVRPVWARATDVLILLLALAAVYVAAFGGTTAGTVFSMSTQWRTLLGLIVVCGLPSIRDPSPGHGYRRDGNMRTGAEPIGILHGQRDLLRFGPRKIVKRVIKARRLT
jgi:hypothetical protein